MREGWLAKQGGRIKTWKNRYVIISGNVLYYFKSPKDKVRVRLRLRLRLRLRPRLRLRLRGLDYRVSVSPNPNPNPNPNPKRRRPLASFPSRTSWCARLP